MESYGGGVVLLLTLPLLLYYFFSRFLFGKQTAEKALAWFWPALLGLLVGTAILAMAIRGDDFSYTDVAIIGLVGAAIALLSREIASEERQRQAYQQESSTLLSGPIPVYVRNESEDDATFVLRYIADQQAGEPEGQGISGATITDGTRMLPPDVSRAVDLLESRRLVTVERSGSGTLWYSFHVVKSSVEGSISATQEGGPTNPAD